MTVGDNEKAAVARHEYSHDNDTTLFSPFTTTSDVLKHLNQALADLDDHNDNNNDNNNNTAAHSRFELQTRLPDGSTRPAWAGEVKAADLQSKINQVAQHVSCLSATARYDWAQTQRRYGNDLLARDCYEAALDVYLTCLLVAKEYPEMFLKVMNNLAHCSLRLGWYQKAILFGTLALEHLLFAETNKETLVEPAADAAAAVCQDDLAKLYYQRGKAYRLRGEYSAAKRDLLNARHYLTSDGSAEQRAVDSELRRVAAAVAEEKRNQARQVRGLQQLWSAKTLTTDDDSSTVSITTCLQPTNTPCAAKSTAHSPSCSRSRRRRRREYSTLRAPVSARPVANRLEGIHATTSSFHERSRTYYWHYYLAVVGRLAEKLLQWMGTNEDDNDNTDANQQEEEESAGDETCINKSIFQQLPHSYFKKAI